MNESFADQVKRKARLNQKRLAREAAKQLAAAKEAADQRAARNLVWLRKEVLPVVLHKIEVAAEQGETAITIWHGPELAAMLKELGFKTKCGLTEGDHSDGNHYPPQAYIEVNWS
jgi:hypothetical protein